VFALISTFLLSQRASEFDENIRKYGHPSSDISAVIRVELIRNSLKITEKFQSSSAALEKRIDELSCGLSDIAERLRPEFFAEARQFELEQELQQIICRIEEIKSEIGTVDQQVGLSCPVPKCTSLTFILNRSYT
jgi:hypothetical protein